MEPDDDDNRLELDKEAQEAADYINSVRKGLVKIRHQIPEGDALLMDMRYGFGDYEGQRHTLEDLAKIWNVTRERVRQIEQKTLAKIRWLEIHQPEA